jgi:hypothetical protein
MWSIAVTIILCGEMTIKWSMSEICFRQRWKRIGCPEILTRQGDFSSVHSIKSSHLNSHKKLQMAWPLPVLYDCCDDDDDDDDDKDAKDDDDEDDNDGSFRIGERAWLSSLTNLSLKALAKEVRISRLGVHMAILPIHENIGFSSWYADDIWEVIRTLGAGCSRFETIETLRHSRPPPLPENI